MIRVDKIGKGVLSLDKLTQQTNLDMNPTGGELQLPREFDTKRFASSWKRKGAEVNAARGNQAVVGTTLSAPGWEPWKYPAERETGELDKDQKPKTEKHPMAGQLHEVQLTGGKEGGGLYVLMFRPQDVQDQVNLAYASLSRERMEDDLKGKTVGGQAPQQGILTERELRKELGPEDPEAQGHGTVIHGGLPQGGSRLSSRIKRVSR